MSQDHEGARRVGERLRQAREQKGMSTSEASERLHILSSYVSAMETGRYGVLPGTVFLRGYVRSYARLLGLNEEEVVAQLDRELGASKEESAKVVEPKPVVTKKRGHPRRWLVALAILLLIAGGLLQYQHVQNEARDAAPLVEEREPPAEGPSDVLGGRVDAPASVDPRMSTAPLEPVPENAPANDLLSDDAAPGIALDDRSAAPTGGPEVDEALSARPALEAPAAEQPVPETQATDVPVDEAGVEVVRTPDEDNVGRGANSAAVGAAADEVAGTPDRLQVNFTGESWFEVEDARGKRRRGLFNAGDSLVFQGQAPFTLVVGAASETQMVFNGVEVDYSRYSVWNNRVGLTLGQ